MASESRDHYIRHPDKVPILLKPHTCAEQMCLSLNIPQYGGLILNNPAPIAVGSALDIHIMLRPVFKIQAVVESCRHRESGYELTLRFIDANSAFRVRMAEQMCHIELYRKAQFQDNGIQLTRAQAASEWIEKFGTDFPNPTP